MWEGVKDGRFTIKWLSISLDGANLANWGAIWCSWVPPKEGI